MSIGMCILHTVLSVSFPYRFPKEGSVYMCPPPDAKSKRQEGYVKSKGVMYDNYDSQLHYALAHLRRVDAKAAAGPDGRKPLNLLAGREKSR